MSQPMEIFESQNVQDDDGAVIDSFLIETDNPPPIQDAQEPIVVRDLPQPKIPSRLMSGEYTLSDAWDVVKMFPADTERKSVNLYVYSPTAVTTDGIRFSDEPGTVFTGGKLLHNNVLTLTDFTGPLYVKSAGNGTNGASSAPVVVEYWNVTL